MSIASGRVRITSVAFQHYKGLGNYSISRDHINILTGANNSGKSTVVGAFRTLAVAMRTARSRKPDRVRVGDERALGYRISETLLPISLENVATNYEDGISRVIFRLSNGNRLHLVFDTEGCALLPETVGAAVSSPTTFKSNFPIELLVVPVLGPVEHHEEVREVDTVSASLSTHRAARHFRNYWYHFPDGFDDFAQAVEKTWPGMRLSRPERANARQLDMFVREGQYDRELYWVGFGFQVWCQLLTHVHRAATSALIVVDEPEVYLHPEIQRRLLGVLKDAGPDILIATHSTEIVAEADPSDIVLIDKTKQSAERIKDVAGVQKAMNVLGSQQNISLTALARNRRVLFVEGDYDYALLRRFARRVGLSDLAAGMGMAAMPSGGFGSWERITVLSDGVEQTLGTELIIGAVYDRDYFCDEQITSVLSRLTKSLAFAHLHERKEIENYLLAPDALDRVLARGIAERRSKGAKIPDQTRSSFDELSTLAAALKDDAEHQYVSRYSEYHQHDKRDLSTRMKEAQKRFRERWKDEQGPFKLVSGKELLRRFREKMQVDFGVVITDARIVDAMHQDDLPPDLVQLLNGIDAFRQARVST